MKNLSKHLIFILTLGCLLSALAFAQSPAAFKYQAVIRDASNTPLTGQLVSIRISILEGSETGNLVYQEFHQPTTSAIGLVALNIGEGANLSGLFEEIDWKGGDHYLQVEVDQAGGVNYEWLGASRLLSVPYAIFADKAGSVDLVAGEGILIAGNEISNAKPSLWQLDSNVVFVDTAQIVAIGISDSIFTDSSSAVPEDAKLFVNGNIRMAEDSALLGVGEIVGSEGINFSA
ncbi:MAG: hypothetical protein AAF804_16285, partial [Bacteroidota bacterium]